MLDITRARRSVACALALVAGAHAVAPRAGAQAVTVSYAPSCGPGTGCASLRFGVANASGSTLVVNTLAFDAASAAFAFTPPDGAGTYLAVDSFGPFGGFSSVVGGTRLFIDFVESGFPLTLDAGALGYVEVTLDDTPRLRSGAFSFVATLEGGATVNGAVAVVPEPATVALVAGGLLGLAAVARRRA